MIVSEVNLLAIIRRLPLQSTMLLHDVGWDEYQALLNQLGDVAGVRFSYSGKKLYRNRAARRPDYSGFQLSEERGRKLDSLRPLSRPSSLICKRL